MKLYELSTAFAELFDRLDDFEGDENGEAAWFDTLDMLETDFSDKAENIAAYIKQLNAEAAILKEQERSFAERRRAKEHYAERLKAYLLREMQAVNLSKIDRPMARISLRNNAETPHFSDEQAFVNWAQNNADELLRYKPPEIDKTAVKKYLQAGHEIDGVTLERSQSVIIK